jgi:hypothetical protein
MIGHDLYTEPRLTRDPVYVVYTYTFNNLLNANCTY